MAEGHRLTGAAPPTGRVGAARAGYAVVLVVLEAGFTLLGWVGGADHGAPAVVFRWSAPAGIVLMLAALLTAGARALPALRTVVRLAAVRVVAVVAAVLAVGSDDAQGRADSSYLLLAVLGTAVALAGLLVAASILRALSPGRRARR